MSSTTQVGVFLNTIIDPVEFSAMNSIMLMMEFMEDKIEAGEVDLEQAEAEAKSIKEKISSLSLNYKAECLYYANNLLYTREFFHQLT